jgi:endonuclease/exonuclease/phosphatase family metal-dependent hydrolase
MMKQFKKIHLHEHGRRRGTFPGPAPFLELDHIYFDPSLELARFRVVRNGLALVASDHLPLLVDFRLKS